VSFPFDFEKNGMVRAWHGRGMLCVNRPLVFCLQIFFKDDGIAFKLHRCKSDSFEPLFVDKGLKTSEIYSGVLALRTKSRGLLHKGVLTLKQSGS
jgi:hypothetical protein